MDIHSFSILSRLELWQLRAFWRVARRDPVFVVAAICLALAALAGLRNMAAAMASSAPAVGLMMAIAVGAGAARLLFPRGGGRVRENLASGPLHELTCEPRPLAQWLLTRTLALCLLLDVILSLAAASRSPIAALVIFPSFAIGAVAWSLAEARLVLRPDRDAPAKTPAGEGVRERSSPRSAWRLLIRLALGTRRRGVAAGVVALGLVALGALCAALAVHNNDEPGLGMGLGIIAAMLAALALSPHPSLVPALRREPLSLVRLYAWLYGPCLILAATGGVAIGLIAALGPIDAARIGFSALVAVLVITVMLYLHQLTRSPRLAPLSLAADLFGGALLVVVEASLGFLWIGGRGAWMAHRARRMRWLDS